MPPFVCKCVRLLASPPPYRSKVYLVAGKQTAGKQTAGKQTEACGGCSPPAPPARNDRQSGRGFAISRCGCMWIGAFLCGWSQEEGASGVGGVKNARLQRADTWLNIRAIPGTISLHGRWRSKEHIRAAQQTAQQMKIEEMEMRAAQRMEIERAYEGCSTDYLYLWSTVWPLFCSLSVPGSQ